ncbi:MULTISPECIES: hypothetical protein [unclassified Microbacterium]|uniref:hypothetical protein n=1 Tax=unclassified Microbacterium TaxID=2609290 RepID=UPI00300F80DE
MLDGQIVDPIAHEVGGTFAVERRAGVVEMDARDPGHVCVVVRQFGADQICVHLLEEVVPLLRVRIDDEVVLAVAALVLLIVLLAVFVLRQGRGRTDRLVTAGSRTDGTTVVDTALAADVLTDALSSQPDLVGSHVSAYRVRTTPMLDVTVTCRRGASPRAVSDVIDDSLSDLENLVGAEIPALVQIRGRFWSRRRGGA